MDIGGIRATRGGCQTNKSIQTYLFIDMFNAIYILHWEKKTINTTESVVYPPGMRHKTPWTHSTSDRYSNDYKVKCSEVDRPFET